MSKAVYGTFWDTNPGLASHVISGWTPTYEGLNSNFGMISAKCTTMGLPGTSLHLTTAPSVERIEQNINNEPHTRSAQPGTRSENDPTFLPDQIKLHMKALLVDNQTICDTTYLVGDSIMRNNNEPLVLDLECHTKWVLPYAHPEGGGSAGFDVDVDDWIDEEHTVIF